MSSRTSATLSMKSPGCLPASTATWFIVGDPDQTIYTWRGADVNLILDFDKLYEDATTIVLSDNYRSTPQILAASNSLISCNACRYPKALKPLGVPGAKPKMYHAKNEKDEAAWIAKTIAGLVKDGHKPADIAILYRAHHVSRPIEDALVKNEIQYVIFSGTAFYQRREVKDVLAYLRMLVTADDLAFMRTFNTPSRGIGRKKLDMLRARAADEGISLYEALVSMLDAPEMKRTGAAKYVETIESCRRLVDTMPLGDLLQRVLDSCGYEEMLRGLSEWERLDNLAELKRAIDEAGHDDDATLESFLTRVALISNMDRHTDNDSAVRMMTVHTAKGMEFDTVFVCGLSEGLFPSKRSIGPRRYRGRAAPCLRGPDKGETEPVPLRQRGFCPRPFGKGAFALYLRDGSRQPRPRAPSAVAAADAAAYGRCR